MKKLILKVDKPEYFKSCRIVYDGDNALLIVDLTNTLFQGQMALGDSIYDYSTEVTDSKILVYKED